MPKIFIVSKENETLAAVINDAISDMDCALNHIESKLCRVSREVEQLLSIKKDAQEAQNRLMDKRVSLQKQLSKLAIK